MIPTAFCAYSYHFGISVWFEYFYNWITVSYWKTFNNLRGVYHMSFVVIFYEAFLNSRQLMLLKIAAPIIMILLSWQFKWMIILFAKVYIRIMAYKQRQLCMSLYLYPVQRVLMITNNRRPINRQYRGHAVVIHLLAQFWNYLDHTKRWKCK